MGFRLIGRERRSEDSAPTAAVSGLMGGSAASLREVVAAADRAVEELEAVVDHYKPRRGSGGRSDSPTFEAEIARTLLSRAESFRNEATELLGVLERAARKLGPEAAEEGAPQRVPFARRSTDPGGAERLRGAPPSTWRGPERRRETSDANMPDATGNGKPIANEGAN